MQPCPTLFCVVIYGVIAVMYGVNILMYAVSITKSARLILAEKAENSNKPYFALHPT